MKNRYERLVDAALDVSVDMLKNEPPQTITAVADAFRRGDRIAVTTVVSIHGGFEVAVDVINHGNEIERVAELQNNRIAGVRNCH